MRARVVGRGPHVLYATTQGVHDWDSSVVATSAVPTVRPLFSCDAVPAAIAVHPTPGTFVAVGDVLGTVNIWPSAVY